MRDLRAQVRKVNWACLSRTQRKSAWIQLCSHVIPGLARAVKKAEGQKAKAEATATNESSEVDRALGKSLGRSQIAVARDLSARKRIYEARLNALLKSRGHAVKQPPRPLLSVKESRTRRTSDNSLTPRRLFQYRRSSIRLVRRVESNSDKLESAEVEPNAKKTYLTPAERRRRHVDRQTLRSQRRMRMFSARMAWIRRTQERESAGVDLWQHAQADASDSRDLWAWPRLAKRERERLAQDVEAFLRGSR